MLKGFVNVAAVRALLAVDGIVVPLQAGQSRGALQVLSVDPPRVTLQRGDRRWTETLFDRPQPADESKGQSD